MAFGDFHPTAGGGGSFCSGPTAQRTNGYSYFQNYQPGTGGTGSSSLNFTSSANNAINNCTGNVQWNLWQQFNQWPPHEPQPIFGSMGSLSGNSQSKPSSTSLIRSHQHQPQHQQNHQQQQHHSSNQNRWSKWCRWVAVCVSNPLALLHFTNCRWRVVLLLCSSAPIYLMSAVNVSPSVFFRFDLHLLHRLVWLLIWVLWVCSVGIYVFMYQHIWLCLTQKCLVALASVSSLVWCRIEPSYVRQLFYFLIGIGN